MKIYVPMLKKDPVPPSPVPPPEPTKAFITVEVGVGSRRGEHRLEHCEGYPLRYYLAQLKLIHAAAHAAVYDMTNLEHGRCRMTYSPGPGAVIRLSPSRVGSAFQFQRVSYNPEELARRMGGGVKEVKKNL